MEFPAVAVRFVQQPILRPFVANLPRLPGQRFSALPSINL